VLVASTWVSSAIGFAGGQEKDRAVAERPWCDPPCVNLWILDVWRAAGDCLSRTVGFLILRSLIR
jgi:hypothetical protein